MLKDLSLSLRLSRSVARCEIYCTVILVNGSRAFCREVCSQLFEGVRSELLVDLSNRF